jgi:hypothetical protein
VLTTFLTVAAAGQTKTVSASPNTTPPWPNIALTSCPTLAEPRNPSERKWKHGQAEQSEFLAAVSPKDPKENARLLSDVVEKFPDSDYLEPALFGEWMSYVLLTDASGQLRVAETLVQLPEAEAVTRTAGFVTLASGLSPYVRPDDPQKDRKLSDLERWVQCGLEASAAQVKPGSMTADAFEKKRGYELSIFDRTAGFVAYTRQDYVVARAKLESANKLNSQDTLTSLWLSGVYFLSPNPDSNSGIFYLARATSLAPLTPGARPETAKAYADFLKQMYKIVHGSDKGLADVEAVAKNNTMPPAGFNVLPPPKVKHHYGSAIAATAIAALVYGFAAHPEFMGEVGRAVAGSLSQSQPAKLMVFGGPGHKVYLGCLSCSQLAQDSIFNPVGPHGSNVSYESIWNRVSQYGSPVSPYSACNPVATDPPVIVDQNGQAYGRLTLSPVNPGIGLGGRFHDWLASAVCQN